MEETSWILAILENIKAVVFVVLLFGLSVFVHEFGHFIAAKLCGLVVDVFSIGFGPALWKRKMGDLELRVGAFPVGGYVALPQLDPSGMESVQGEGETEKKRALPPVSPWKKIIVTVSGAAGNIVFALLLAYIVYWSDKPQLAMEGAVVGAVETNSAAWNQGLRPGDTVLSVNDQQVETWNAFMQVCALNNTVNLTVKHSDGAEAALSLETSTNANPFQIRSIEGVEQGSPSKVGLVLPGSMAEKAGVKSGDVIKYFNGQTVASRWHLIDMVQEREGQSTALVVERDGKPLELSVTPMMDPDKGRILMGIEFDVRVKPLEQIRQDVIGIVRMLKALVTPAQAGHAAKSLGGPLSIFAVFWLYAKSNFILLLTFARFLNVNLAILNLLPIPVLDGGHVVFALWEGLTRRPPREKVVKVLVNGFAILLITLVLFLTFRDFRFIQRLVNQVRQNASVSAPEPVLEEPPAVPGEAK